MITYLILRRLDNIERAINSQRAREESRGRAGVLWLFEDIQRQINRIKQDLESSTAGERSHPVSSAMGLGEPPDRR